MFDQELRIFSQEQENLQAEYPSGGFVVIYNDEILGVWQSRVDGLRAGIEKYGNVPFLLRNIDESDRVITFSRNVNFLSDACISK